MYIYIYNSNLQITEAAIACSMCGKFTNDERSCCAPGGTWFQKCGNKDAAHTWADGIQACEELTAVTRT